MMAYSTIHPYMFVHLHMYFAYVQVLGGVLKLRTSLLPLCLTCRTTTKRLRMWLVMCLWLQPAWPTTVPSQAPTDKRFVCKSALQVHAELAHTFVLSHSQLNLSACVYVFYVHTHAHTCPIPRCVNTGIQDCKYICSICIPLYGLFL